MAFDYLGRVEALTPANLTLRERARLAENPNDLRWRGIFPKADAMSVKLAEIGTADFRPAGGRREWNAQGREIPLVLGSVVNAEMVPINPTHHIDERRLQALRERTGANADAGVVADVDTWATVLADAADVQIERDAFEAWFKNEITVMDPKTGTTVVSALGLDSARYVAAASTLAAAANAYTLFMTLAANAEAALGTLGPVRMRRARLNEILADAPVSGNEALTLTGLNNRLQAEGYGAQIVVDERTYHTFTDGGSAHTAAYYVPADRIAFAPASGVVGATHFAPVTRAYDFMDLGNVKTVNDFTVFHSPKNDGKTLMVEAQANALALPIEQNVYVVTGVA